MSRKTIGTLSRECGVKVTTIRYYESIGLIQEPDRTGSGRRIYDDAAVEQLNFIRHARDLGFPMDAIRELIFLQESPGTNCARVDRIAQGRLVDVRRRLTQLKALEAELTNMISICEGGTIANCKVLQTLSSHDECLDEHGPREKLRSIDRR